jgi:hypothetical protein
MWIEYDIESFADGSFTVRGAWNKEVMGYDADGNPGQKSNPLYQPGDVFIVDDNGILRKQEPVTSLVYTYEASKK